MDTRDLSEHVAYRAGGGIEEVARELGRDPGDLVKLASNENPLGPTPAAVEAIREAASEVHHYPKAAHADLTAALAAEWGVTEAQVWLSPGADGAFDYLHRAMLDPGDRVLVPDPGFAYYGMSARYHHGAVATYDIRADADAAGDGDEAGTERGSDAPAGFEQSAERVLEAYDGERMIFVTTPHNPTGSECPLDGIEAIAEGTAEDTLVVADEAYGEFSESPSAISLLAEREDVAVARTFSKAYGLAGLRLGYALVPEAWADAYALVNTPFAASAVACRAGLAALEAGDHVEAAVETARRNRRYLAERLDAPTYESAANFVLVEVGEAERVADAMKERGVIVRDCTSFGLPSCVRITAGTDAETARAVEALNEVLAV
jgi:histidinol-phosphate aminotransferase